MYTKFQLLIWHRRVQNIAQTWHIHFSCTPVHMCVMAACPSVSWVFSGMRGPDTKKAVEGLRNATHIYIIYLCLTFLKSLTALLWPDPCTLMECNTYIIPLLGTQLSHVCTVVWIWTVHAMSEEFLHTLSQHIGSWNFVYSYY